MTDRIGCPNCGAGAEVVTYHDDRYAEVWLVARCVGVGWVHSVTYRPEPDPCGWFRWEHRVRPGPVVLPDDLPRDTPNASLLARGRARSPLDRFHWEDRRG